MGVVEKIPLSDAGPKFWAQESDITLVWPHIERINERLRGI